MKDAAPLPTLNYTPDDSLRFKGLGILLIALHNFMHLLRPWPLENEFFFSHERAAAFFSGLVQHPEDSLRILLSFWGHFGVQVFIFISAYGLSRKFAAQPPGWGAFMLSRLKKLYPLFLLVVLLWIGKTWLFYGGAAAVEPLLNDDLLYVLLGISNLVPGQALAPVGPWWFLPFILQVYALFPLLFWYAQKTGGRGLLLLGAVGMMATAVFNEPLLARFDINLYYTFAAHLPELCLGVYLAQRKAPIPFPKLWVAAAAVIFLLGNMFWWAWPASHASVLVLLLAADAGFRKTRVAQRVFLFFGAIAMPLFLINAVLRSPLLEFARGFEHPAAHIGFAIIFLALITAVAWPLRWLDDRMHARGRPLS